MVNSWKQIQFSFKSKSWILLTLICPILPNYDAIMPNYDTIMPNYDAIMP